MEMIQIGKHKLKVTMTKPDMCEYELDCEKMESGDFHTRFALKRILKKAKEQCGFDAKSDRMLVQIFPSKNGGCEIFVTVLELDAEREDLICDVVLKCENFDSLLTLCSRLNMLGYDGESTAYCSENGGIFLKITGKNMFPCICEYAKPVSYEKFVISEWEHMHIIDSPDAVHTLAAFYV